MKTTPSPLKETGKLLILSRRDEEILRAFYFYRFMTALDVTHLFFSPKSLNHVREMLSRLGGGSDGQTNQYLYRFTLPTVARESERIYALGNRGRDFLANQVGLAVDWYFRPDRLSHLSYSYLMHHLTLTRFLVAASVWAKRQPDFRLTKTRISYELEHTPTIITLTSEEKTQTIKVVPDAWLLFERLKNGQHERFFPVLLEIDRGTEYSQKFKQQIRSRIEFVKKGGAYRKLFGTEAVTIAYATTGHRPEYKDARRRALCTWTREVLDERGSDKWASVFRFHSLTLKEMYQSSLFEEPVWYRPDSDTPVTLFPV